jgi:hypothetical protein
MSDKVRWNYKKKITAQGVMDCFEAAPNPQMFQFRMVRWAQEQGAKEASQVGQEEADEVRKDEVAARDKKDTARKAAKQPDQPAT